MGFCVAVLGAVHKAALARVFNSSYTFGAVPAFVKVNLYKNNN
jgi:hypothetical protein